MTDQATDIQRQRAANPLAIPVADVARLLNVAEEKIREHIVAGAPTAADGTINLVHYAAWLNQRLRDRDGD